MTMNCNVCFREFKGKRKAFCPSCAQATLYESRAQQAAGLLSREKAHTHVEAVVRPGNDGILAALPEDADWDAIQAGVKTHGCERAKAEKAVADERVRDITSKAEELRQQIEACKALAKQRKEENARRRTDLDKERTLLEKRRTQALEPVHSAIRKAKHRLNKVHGRTIEAREYLCKEASSLNGLKRARKQDGKAQYWLMGLPLPDLRDLNGSNSKLRIESIDSPSGRKSLAEPYELISTSLDNLSRFMGICCHYLSIRLPAEILLPHNDFPHAAILPVDSSYRTTHLRYPGNPSSQTSSPAASRILQRSEMSRPRLLQLDRPLPQLQKEEPKTAAFFREGVVLLAYDLAWLCRSQGLDSINSFEEAWELGRNLYELFPAKDGKSRPKLDRNISTVTGKPERSTTAMKPDANARLGSYSHGSVHHSIAGYEGDALFGPSSSWHLSIPKLADQLKSYLRRETARAEWDIITDTEWDEELEDERPVLVGGTARPSLDKKGGPAMSVATIKPSDGDDDVRPPGPARGSSGWMKIRGRGGET